MKQINLIAWREQRREQRKQEFFISWATALVITLLLIGISHFILANAISNQSRVNKIYEREINQLNKQLGDIDQVRTQQQIITERINVIDKLQANRSQTVYIFNDIVKTIPKGIYLTSIKRIDDTIQLIGKAESNAHISTFMRSLETLSWASQALLSQIQTNSAANVYSNDFSLALKLNPFKENNKIATEDTNKIKKQSKL